MAANYFEEIERSHHRARRIKIYFLLGLFFAFFILIVYLIFLSPLFKIRDFEIRGNQAVAQKEILDFLPAVIIDHSELNYFLGYNNFFSWPNQLNGDELKLLPIIKAIDFQKNFWNHLLIINVQERQPYGIWCFEKTEPVVCFWFDEEGVAFKKGVKSEGNLILAIDDYSSPSFSLGSKILPEKFLDNFFSIVQVIKEAELNVGEIRLNDIGLEELEVDLNSGPKIYFSLRFNSQNDLAVLNDLKTSSKLQSLKIIDFRSENKALYR